LPVAPERVGQDDVGTGLDELLMECPNLLGLIQVPELWWVAGPETTLEVVGAGRPIREESATAGQQIGK